MDICSGDIAISIEILGFLLLLVAGIYLKKVVPVKTWALKNRLRTKTYYTIMYSMAIIGVIIGLVFQTSVLNNC